MRVRGFVQDDAHIFCTEEQIVADIQSLQRIGDEGIQTIRLP